MHIFYVRTYVCMYLCMYVCMYPHIYVCTYVGMYVCIHILSIYVCRYVCVYVRMHACTYVCMYVRMHACMYVCLYIYLYVCMYVSSLPFKEAFYSKLNESHITDGEYDHAQNVWSTFSINDLGEYHYLYLKTDVRLLADVFENFDALRITCRSILVLYFPWVGMEHCVKNDWAKVRTLDRPVYAANILKGYIRGGVSMISTRYGKANNPYMTNYDPNESTQYIQYVDANNLYGWAMSQMLPAIYSFIHLSLYIHALVLLRCMPSLDFKQELFLTKETGNGHLSLGETDYMCRNTTVFT